MKLVGRKKEIGELEDLYLSGQAEFVAVLERNASSLIRKDSRIDYQSLMP